MKFINPIYFIKETSKGIDDVGDIILDKQERKVMAHIQSTKQSEFYQAQALGIKPELTFIVRAFAYKNEDIIKYNNKQYNVLRTYDKCDGTIEIVCIGAVNNGNS